MKKYIHIKKEDREFITKAFGVSGRCVFNALSFNERRGNSELCRKIRRLAIMRGGVVMVKCPELETLHDNDGYMRQYLPNGSMLEFSKENGGCDVYHKGKKVCHYDNVAIKDMAAITSRAAALA